MKSSSAALAAALLLALPAAARADVVNGGFEAGDFSGWTVTGAGDWTGVDALAARSGQHGAFFGEDAPGSAISQTFATLAGQVYRVSFWLQLDDSAAPNAFSWSWNGATQASLNDAAGFAWREFSADVTALGSTATIGFSFVNPNSFYLLDDVTVTAVPEPGRLALLLAGLAAVAATARRRIRR